MQIKMCYRAGRGREESVLRFSFAPQRDTQANKAREEENDRVLQVSY